eukprot:m.89858 g.89858  ORF g.89858 m.89858 type:complete len:328 (+) comp16451_c0_seq17:1323-2306(+)
MDRLLPMLYKDLSKNDISPSALCKVIAGFGTFMEFALGALCSHPSTQHLGAYAAFSFHVYIMSMMPFASVQEWNLFCIILANFLFNHHPMQLPEGGVHPALLVFLVTVLLVIPAYGQLFPTKWSFLFAFRPYAGNWRFAVSVLDKKAESKLRKLKTMESIFLEESSKFVLGADARESCRQQTWFLLGNLVYVPAYRPMVCFLDALERRNQWAIGDYRIIFQEVFLNNALGWGLGVGWHWRPQFFTAIQKICGFEKGEFLTMICEPTSPIDHIMRWKIVDVADAATFAHGIDEFSGEVPYSELEQYPPHAFPTERFLAAANKHRKKLN